MEAPHHLEHGGHLLDRRAGGEGEFVETRLQVTALVNVADQQLGDVALGRVEIRQADLFEEVFLERGAGHERIEHELAALLVFLPAPERQVGLGELIRHSWSIWASFSNSA